MKKKTLLSEGTIRKFMKLANIGHLQESFFEEEKNEEGDLSGEEMPAEDDLGAEDAEPSDMPAPEAPRPDEAPEAESAEEVEITEDDRAILAQAAEILARIGGAASSALSAPEMAAPELPIPDEAPMPEEEPLDEVEVVDEEKLVQEVTRRVAQRIKALAKKK